MSHYGISDSDCSFQSDNLDVDENLIAEMLHDLGQEVQETPIHVPQAEVQCNHFFCNNDQILEIDEPNGQVPPIEDIPDIEDVMFQQTTKSIQEE